MNVPFDYDTDPERYRRGMAVTRMHAAGNLYRLVATWQAELDAHLVLDVGCGEGALREALPPTGPNAIGLDRSATMLASHPAPAVGGDAAHLPFAAAIFDAVTTLNVLYHLPDPLPAIQDAHRVLRAAGTPAPLTGGSDAAERTGPAHNAHRSVLGGTAMRTYSPVPLPTCEPGGVRAPEILHAITEWVGSVPLRDLVTHFGGALPETGASAALEYLDGFSEAKWDFRRGRERYESERREFPADTDQLVRDAARALGLSGRDQPEHRSYSHLLVLGGRVRTCLVRANHAAALVRDGVAVDQVAGLASLRPCDPEEVEQAKALGLTTYGTEFDGMTAGLRTAFALTGAYERRSGDTSGESRTSWRVAAHRRADLAVRVVAAPSSTPERRRANTADTLTFWADTVGELTDNDRVLLVTSSLHVPFQHCDAIRVLGIRYGCGVDTVGTDGETTSGQRLRFRHRSTTLLQEIRSTIRSMRRLVASLVADTGGAGISS